MPDSMLDVEITYFTDPLCSWSWALEPAWRRLRYELGDHLGWRYRMGGMIPDWSRYADPISDVAAPTHMGPQWLEVSRRSGMPIDPRLWHDDPPASSYPACLAVKAAELQGHDVGDRYLRRAREAAMLERRNTARREVLLALADELASVDAARCAADALDPAAFRRALDDGTALAAFRADLQEARYREIGRFPTLVVRGAARGVILVGYRPYDVLLVTVRHVAPDLARRRTGTSAVEYAAFWRGAVGRLTAREMVEACMDGSGAAPAEDALP